MLLAGDIGGTKTVLAIFSPDAGVRTPLAEATFPSKDYPSLQAIAREFLEQAGLPVERASFGVAGPVVEGRATVTNLPWIIDETELREGLGLQTVHLLNDLESIAHGVLLLTPDELHTLNEGDPEPGGAIGIIAPGTGLGEAFLTWDGSRYHPQPSEGGHTDFAPTDSEQLDLLRYLLRSTDHVSFEKVCSGLGIPNIYAFLRDTGRAVEPAWLAEELAQAEDRTPIIVRSALDPAKPAELCVAALNMFVEILASETANLALKVLAMAGVYLGGGIPPRILPALASERFSRSFRNKGRMSGLVTRVPVRVILNPMVALFGVASYGLETGSWEE